MDIEEKDSLIKLLNSMDKRVFQLGLMALSKKVKKEEFLSFVVRYSFFKTESAARMLLRGSEISFLEKEDLYFIECFDVKNKLNGNIIKGLNKYTLNEILKALINNIYDNS